MTNFRSALWAELLKARRSMMSLMTALGISILPLAGALFVIILKDPERARQMGLISAKAQIMVGVADWPAYFGILLQGMAAAGAVLFALIASWVFGGEFSNRTAKDLLALPTSRAAIVSAKLGLLAIWDMALALLLFLIGLVVGSLLDIPGWSAQLEVATFGSLMLIAFLTFMLMPLVAFVASAGRGYLPPMGWALFSLALAQIAAVLGWGDWVPWSVPLLGRTPHKWDCTVTSRCWWPLSPGWQPHCSGGTAPISRASVCIAELPLRSWDARRTRKGSRHDATPAVRSRYLAVGFAERPRLAYPRYSHCRRGTSGHSG
jgi:ABC-type transport system involved in multi-copper enzyme maturation permease subunit